MKMSQEYWSAPASAEYEAKTDGYYNQGAADKAAGRKANLRGIPNHHRCFYMAGYRAGIATAA
jgi:hypothetical protein